MVAAPVLANADELPLIINHSIKNSSELPIDFNSWLSSGYQPTHTIVEAAQALYQQHGVEEIARSDAGAQNLGLTADCIAEIIERSKVARRKSICLVTGVPGAGKTLAGLNIATKRAQEYSDEHAVFLSGNGPLVAVLREALARDECGREKISKKTASRKVASFIQNIHHFRDESVSNAKPPYERVVVFDEAQRAWTQDQATKFMQTKRGHSNFNMSEPEFLISVMDRHDDWCVVVCLIGGGQEINTGEAGLIGWSSLLSEIDDNRQRFDGDAQALQCLGGTAPVTKRSGKYRHVYQRWACDKHLRHAIYLFAEQSLSRCVWAELYYRHHRQKDRSHANAIRRLGHRWLKIIHKMWIERTPYNAELHHRNQLQHGSWIFKLKPS